MYKMSLDDFLAELERIPAVWELKNNRYIRTGCWDCPIETLARTKGLTMLEAHTVTKTRVRLSELATQLDLSREDTNVIAAAADNYPTASPANHQTELVAAVRARLLKLVDRPVALA